MLVPMQARSNSGSISITVFTNLFMNFKGIAPGSTIEPLSACSPLSRCAESCPEKDIRQLGRGLSPTLALLNEYQDRPGAAGHRLGGRPLADRCAPEGSTWVHKSYHRSIANPGRCRGDFGSRKGHAAFFCRSRSAANFCTKS